MADINLSIFTGNLVKDCELTEVNGVFLSKFCIACNKVVLEKNDKETKYVDKPYFLNTHLWGERAKNLSPYLKKGVKISVQGHWENVSWEKDGKKIFKDEFRIIDIQFISGVKNKGKKDISALEKSTSHFNSQEEKGIYSSFEIY